MKNSSLHTLCRLTFLNVLLLFNNAAAQKVDTVAWDRTKQEQTVICDGTDVVRVLLIYDSHKHGSPIHVDRVYVSGDDASEWLILANQTSYSPMGNFDMKQGDTIWVDIEFKAELFKPFPQKYFDRHSKLFAILNNTDTIWIDLIGQVFYGEPVIKPSKMEFSSSGSSTIVISNRGTAPLVAESSPIIFYPIKKVSGFTAGDTIRAGDSIRVNIEVELTSDIDTLLMLNFLFHTICNGNVFDTIHVKAKSIVSRIQNYEPMTIRPNPASGNTVILSYNASRGNNEVSILDVLGKERYKSYVIPQSKQLKIPISNLPNGTYYARISSAGKIATEKFEVQR